MEERLDDAINVLRNHAESQIVLGQLPNSLAPHQLTQLGYSAPPTADPHLPDPVKVERPTYNTSELNIIYLFGLSRDFDNIRSKTETKLSNIRIF